ncbi:MAG: FAD-dependent oxidoreductase, partial [Bacteroidota bacterium]
MTYDLIVIGAGQAGPPLAYAFADAGRRVALIEAHYLGGTCVNYGCTPTKTMMASARVAHTARRATRYGVHVGDVKVNLEAVVARKNQIVLSFRSGQADRIEQNENIDLYRGRGKFTGPKTVEVDGGTLTAETICINVGTRPRMPAIPGLGEVDALTNRTMLD